MSNFSDNFKINVNKLNADEALIVLLEIEHALLPEPVRLVNDVEDIVSNGHNYMAMGFDVKWNNDAQGELPKVQLVMQNVGRSMMRWIDMSNGASYTTIRAKVIRRSDPDTVEESLKLQVERITANLLTITFNLVIQNQLIRRGIKRVFTKEKAPGLF